MKDIKFIFQRVEISTIQITFLALLWWVIGCHSASVDDQNINYEMTAGCGKMNFVFVVYLDRPVIPGLYWGHENSYFTS